MKLFIILLLTSIGSTGVGFCLGYFLITQKSLERKLDQKKQVENRLTFKTQYDKIETLYAKQSIPYNRPPCEMDYFEKHVEFMLLEEIIPYIQTYEEFNPEPMEKVIVKTIQIVVKE